MKSRRAFADPVTLYLLAGLAAGIVVGSWKPLNAFKKPPPTAQLTELQGKLDAALVQAAAAAQAAETAKMAERAKLEEQIHAAQADNEGTVASLKRVPPAAQTPEVKLASRFANRVSLKLALTVGALPRDQQEAMVDLVEQALSDKQAEVDAANVKLAQMDADFKATTAQRDALRVEIPKLTERATKAEEQAKAVQSEVTAMTDKVKTWADKADTALRESGSLWGSVKKAVWLIGGGYVFLVFILPGIVKHLAPENPFKGLLRDASGYLSSPMLYHDAKAKIKEALYTPAPPSKEKDETK
jgi:hypothetical protein